MSRDDWVGIIKRKTFKAYSLCASMSYSTNKDVEERGFLIFEAKTLEEAISRAQAYPSEYGYIFLNKKFNRHGDTHASSYFTTKGDNDE